MFWIGFLIMPGIMLLLFCIMKGSRKLLNRLKNIFVNVRVIVCTMMFTILTYILTLVYSIVALASGNMVINAMLCAVFLVFSWCIVEKLYQILAEEDNNTETEKVLSYKDKNICQLCALIAVTLSGAMMSIQNDNRDYIILLSIAISIWIGAYVPISEIYKGMRIKAIFKGVLNDFKNKNPKVTITAIVSTTLLVILISKNELVEKINLVIEEIGKGIATSSIILILGLIVYGLTKKKQSV